MGLKLGICCLKMSLGRDEEWNVYDGSKWGLSLLFSFVQKSFFFPFASLDASSIDLTSESVYPIRRHSIA